jgi:hypothetical protein
VNEIIEYLETEESVLAGDIYITPPENIVNSDEDSGDEENPNINHLCKHQLLSEAEFQATIFKQDGLDIIDDFPDHSQSEAEVSTSSGKSSVAKKRCVVSRKWKDVDIQEKREKTSTTPDFSEGLINPVDFFELFFDADVFELLRSETQKNAVMKGKCDFRVTTTEMKHFIGILL